MKKNNIYLISRFQITIWTIVLFCICAPILSGQQTRYSLLGNKPEIVLPFEYHQGFIIVDLVFQKMIPLRFIVDTGAENTILLKREYASMMQLKYHKKIQLHGSDMSRTLYAFICNGTFLQLVNTETVRHNIIVLEVDHLFLEEYIGTKVDGILGAEFFKGYILKIDYSRALITISDPLKYRYSDVKNYHKYDIDIVNNKPYLDCITEVQANVPIKTKMLIDTGAGLTALFHNNTDSLLKTPESILKGTLGKGLGGDIEGFTGKIHRLSLGDIEFTNMISSFQDLDNSMISPDKIVRNGIIGNLLLERFDVVFDLYKSNLYLKPKKNYNKDFEFDKSGMTIFAFGENLKEFYVKYVIKDSPADEVDIRPGDIILKVNIWSRRWYSLRRLNKKFIGDSGKKVKLKIQRGGEVLIKTIVLRDLFEKTESSKSSKKS